MLHYPVDCAESTLFASGILQDIHSNCFANNCFQFQLADWEWENIPQACRKSEMYVLQVSSRSLLTAHFSMQHHSSAVEDSEKVASLTPNTFDNAHLMNHICAGHFTLAQSSWESYIEI